MVALIALAFTVLPGGGPALGVMLALLSIAFFTVIAVFGYRLYRQFRFELDGLTERQRLVLYGSIGIAFLTFCATDRLFDEGGAGVGAWFALLALGLVRALLGLDAVPQLRLTHGIVVRRKTHPQTGCALRLDGSSRSR